MTVVFVTGGTGFLGMQMVKMLVQCGDRVCALHRSPKDAVTSTWSAASSGNFE